MRSRYAPEAAYGSTAGRRRRTAPCRAHWVVPPSRRRLHRQSGTTLPPPRGWPGQQGKIARHHQALNVMSIGIPPGAKNGLSQAVHHCLAGPVECRQRPHRSKEVAQVVSRHLQPVDTEHLFPPAQDLAHKPFHRGQRSPAALIGSKGCLAYLPRSKKTNVDIR